MRKSINSMVSTGYPKKVLKVVRESMKNSGVKTERKFDSGIRITAHRNGLKINVNVEEPGKGLFMYEFPVGVYHKEKRTYGG